MHGTIDYVFHPCHASIDAGSIANLKRGAIGCVWMRDVIMLETEISTGRPQRHF